VKFPKALTSGQQDLLNSFEGLRLPSFFSAASCAAAEPALFQSSKSQSIRAAKVICAQCPIRARCLEWAVANREDGVWGGTTAQERQKLVVGPTRVEIDELAERRERRARLLEQESIEALAQEFNVTQRTIHRWREQIQNEAS
jgi:WhiB family redox-sensing transcriptional regulator